MRLPAETGYSFMGEPVRITWPLHSCSSSCASRPANQRSDSTGQVSEAASSTAPTTTSLIRMLRLCAKFAKPEQHTSARTNPACMPLLAINP
jgi:hypothetical protein